MALANTLEVLINAKDNTAQEFQKFETNLNRVAEGFTSAGKKMMLSGVVMGGAIELAVRGFMKEGQIVTKLTHILRTSVNATDEQIESLKTQARELQKVGVVSDMTTMAFQAQMAAFDLHTDTIKSLTPAILDMAVAEKGINVTSQDMVDYANAIGMAMEGNYMALTRRGFKIDDNTKLLIKNGNETEKAAAIIAYLSTVYEGLNEEMRNTPAGRLAILKNEFSDMQQALATSMIPLLTDMMSMASGAVERLSAWFQSLSPYTREAIGQMMVLAPIILVAGGALSFVVGKTIMFITTLMHAHAWFVALGSAGQASMLGIAKATALIGLSLIGVVLLLEMASAAYATYQAKRGANIAKEAAMSSEAAVELYGRGEITKEEAQARMRAAQMRGAVGVGLASGRTGTERFQASEMGRFFSVFANINVKKEDEIGELVNTALKPALTGE